MPDTPLNPDARTECVDMLLEIMGYPRDELFEYPHRADDSIRYITRAERTLDKILAVAQPEVNSVESIPAHVQVISWEEEPEHECWKLAPDETFVGLIVKSDRAWSPADRYTLNIDRPEVDDA